MASGKIQAVHVPLNKDNIYRVAPNKTVDKTAYLELTVNEGLFFIVEKEQQVGIHVRLFLGEHGYLSVRHIGAVPIMSS